MAELDYAYLADFAAVQDGKLNAIGASFTFLRSATLPATQMLAVAGRVRSTADEGPVVIEISIVTPNNEVDIRWSGAMEAGQDMLAYGPQNRVGLLFALTTTVPLPAAGLYTVTINIDGEFARRLAFEVELSPVS